MRSKPEHEEPSGRLRTSRELERELRRFEEEMRAAGLAESTVRTQAAGVKRFLRWLAGDRGATGARPQSSRGLRQPLRGLAYLDWFRDTASLDELGRTLRDYEVLTGYDSSLRKLRRQVGPAMDLTAAGHRSALLKWLREWGCRHLRRADEERSSAALLEWWNAWRGHFPPPEATLTDLSGHDLDRACAAYAGLAVAEAAGRSRGTGESTVRFGETAAAKALYVLRPGVFLPWDEPIRRAFGGPSASGATYRRFLDLVAETLSGLAARLGVKVEDLPPLLGRPDSTPPKLVDEYLWATITRGGGKRG